MSSPVNIEELYDKYSRKLFCTSLRITGNRCDAEEVMQDTFLKYYNYHQKNDIEQLSNWLTSICIRKSIDMLRSRNRSRNFLENYSRESGDTVLMEKNEESFFESNKDNRIKIEKIKEALNDLPDKYRLVLSLHLFEGYDYNEIEQITGIKDTYIRSLYMRGKAKLIEILEQPVINRTCELSHSFK